LAESHSPTSGASIPIRRTLSSRPATATWTVSPSTTYVTVPRSLNAPEFAVCAPPASAAAVAASTMIVETCRI